MPYALTQMDKVKVQIKAIETELESLYEELDRIDTTHYGSYARLVKMIESKQAALKAMRNLLPAAG